MSGNEGRLQEKVALITGGGSGIGRASAMLFASEGAKVVIAGRRAEAGEETVSLIEQGGGSAFFVSTDISQKEQVERLVAETVKKYKRLDCAFNCGGIDGKKAPLVDLEEHEWNEIIDINLKGTFFLLQAEIKQMLRQGKGAIVNMASVCSVIARPNRVAYNTSRHGVLGLTKSAALEYAKFGIKINAVGPGSIETDIFRRSTQNNPALEKAYAEAHPINRIGQPEEVAEAALWLCSDNSSFIVGHNLMIDGGLTII